MTSILVAALLWPRHRQPAAPAEPHATSSDRRSAGRRAEPFTPGAPPRSIEASSTRPRTAFAEAVAMKGERADGALVLERIRPQQAWTPRRRAAGDCHAAERLPEEPLAAATRARSKSRFGRPAGRRAVPDRNGDEDLKLMALGGLMNADPDRALPLVEQMLATSQSDKVRDRALFVLAQSGSPKAREVLVRIARTGPDEDTQKRAIRYLGLFGGPESRQALVDIYKSSQSVSARKAVLQGFMVAGDRARLLEVARTETSPELKREAIHMIGVVGRTRRAVAALSAGDVGRGQRRDHQRAVRRRRRRTAGRARAEGNRPAAAPRGHPEARADRLVQVGAPCSSSCTAPRRTPRSSARSSTRSSSRATPRPWSEIARAETDPGLKREAVQKLSLMQSKEAADYMMELLK